MVGGAVRQHHAHLRTGVTPYGKALDPEFMPWDVYANMTDEELKALWMYLQSLEAR